jgi:S1-C subfamily serine protease
MMVAVALGSFLLFRLDAVAHGDPVLGSEAALSAGLTSQTRIARRSMVEIVDMQMRRLGLGVVVAPQRVLISAHYRIPSDGAGLLVRRSSGDGHAFTVLARDANDGLCLLDVPDLPAGIPAIDFAAAVDPDHPPRPGGLTASVGVLATPLASGMIAAVDRTISGMESFGPVPIRMLDQGQGEPRRTPVRFFPLVLQHDSLLSVDELGSLLVSSRGEVLGLNVSNVLHGISYAVPSSRIAEALGDLMQGRDVPARPRGFLGVEAYPAPVSLLRQLGVPGAVILRRVIRGRAADEAGLLAGDVLLSIDRRPVLDTLELVQDVSAREPGSVARVSIIREGARLEVPVRIGTTGW